MAERTRWLDWVKAGLCGAGLVYLTVAIVWPYAYARGLEIAVEPPSRARIIEAYPNPLYGHEVALFPNTPNWIVRFFDHQGEWHEELLTEAGLEAMRKAFE